MSDVATRAKNNPRVSAKRLYARTHKATDCGPVCIFV
jgi:hypothetical protein